jgi:hypothetical protein
MQNPFLAQRIQAPPGGIPLIHKSDVVHFSEIPQPIKEPLIKEPLIKEPLIKEPLIKGPLIKGPLIKGPPIKRPIINIICIQKNNIITLKSEGNKYSDFFNRHNFTSSDILFVEIKPSFTRQCYYYYSCYVINSTIKTSLIEFILLDKCKVPQKIEINDTRYNLYIIPYSIINYNLNIKVNYLILVNCNKKKSDDIIKEEKEEKEEKKYNHNVVK